MAIYCRNFFSDGQNVAKLVSVFWAVMVEDVAKELKYKKSDCKRV